MIKLFRIPVFVALAFLLTACEFSLAEDIAPPPGSEVSTAVVPQPIQVMDSIYPIVPPDPAKGAAIYAEKCAPCHGVSGNGDGPSAVGLSVPVTALADPQLARQRSLAEWFAIVTQGKIESIMPPFASLSDRQRWDVVAYAFSLSETTELIAQGQAIYEANCASCHGQRGQGDGPTASEASVKPGDFTDQKTMSLKSAAALVSVIQAGAGAAMPAYEGLFSEDEMWTLAAYIRYLGYASQESVASVETTQTETEAGIEKSADTVDPTIESAVGNVQVSVVDESGNSLAADYPVTLYAFDNMQYVYDTTLTASTGGIYLFEKVEMPPERAFLASVDYNGVVYGSDVGVSSEPGSPIILSITVYEPTTDTSSLIVDRLHIFFDFSTPENVQVVELYILRNMANRSVVAEEKGGPIVQFALPEGATNLQFEDGVIGERYILTPQGFADTRTVQAGVKDHQVVFAYNLPYNRKLSFAQLQGMAINSAVILVPEGIKLRGEDLLDEGLRDLQGVNYQMYTMSSLPAGSMINLEISGKPKTATAAMPDTRTGLLIGLGALGLALIIAGVWLYRRERSNSALEVDSEDMLNVEFQEEHPTDPDQIMDAIIALDDMYKTGELPKEAYQQRRNELKTQLEKAMNKP